MGGSLPDERVLGGREGGSLRDDGVLILRWEGGSLSYDKVLAPLRGAWRGGSLLDERVLAFEEGEGRVGGSLLDEMVLDLILGGRWLLLK